MICLLVMTDGRDDLLTQSIASARENLRGSITERVIYDDTGDPTHAEWLREWFHDFTVIAHPEGRQGFGGAIRCAWSWLRRHSEAEYVFHAEDDFTYNAPVHLDHMAGILDGASHLVQIALRRQPWNDEERAAGGIVELHPDDYEERWLWRMHYMNCCPDGHDPKVDPQVHAVLEHRRFFTTNPSLYRRDLILNHDWPVGENSEGVFTHQLLRDPAVRFGFWGARDSGEAVTHIGTIRAGQGY